MKYSFGRKDGNFRIWRGEAKNDSKLRSLFDREIIRPYVRKYSTRALLKGIKSLAKKERYRYVTFKF